MPKIDQYNQIDIALEKFLDACSNYELIELDMLLNSPKYQKKINEYIREKESEIESGNVREYSGLELYQLNEIATQQNE